MSLHRLSLSWFRGASLEITLQPRNKSMVVYGENGSGKSSFVDAIEYLLNNQRVGHLAHEYSGKHQENALLNVSAPEGSSARIALWVDPNTSYEIRIDPDGHAHIESEDAADVLDAWAYRRVVLRQDEVANFVNDTKGEKYSALLPLLGLEEYEQAAENLRQLAKSVEDEGQVAAKAALVRQSQAEARRVIGEISKAHITQHLQDLWSRHEQNGSAPADLQVRCTQLADAIEKEVASLGRVNKAHAAVSALSSQRLVPVIQEARNASGRLAKVAEELVAKHVAVLRRSRDYIEELSPPGEKSVRCPACGTQVLASDLRRHIASELERLNAIEVAFNRRAEAFRVLWEAVNTFKKGLAAPSARSWLQKLAGREGQSDHILLFQRVQHKDVLPSARPEVLDKLEAAALAIQRAAKTSTRSAPPEIKALVADRDRIKAIDKALGATRLNQELGKVRALVALIKGLETAARNEIREQSERVIDHLTGDIRAFWEVLHPGEPIRDVQLYLPDDADKAIDIGLSFYGVEQDSPRLTLSEGHRNSLGLCVFLAMAKQGDATERPIVLDDVVVSFDRNHRGMIADLLAEHFSDRQVLVLTHDRGWFTDLVKQLPVKSWDFVRLLPWEDPVAGIRIADPRGNFDDARALVNGNASSAGHEARRVMDIELAFLAEKLAVPMPYMRSDRNDHRVAHDFLLRLKAETPKRLRVREDGQYVPIQNSGELLGQAATLLETWGNKGTHTHDVVPSEASKLIEACEAALGLYTCKNVKCGEDVWRNTASNGSHVQCSCGAIRWKY